MTIEARAKTRNEASKRSPPRRPARNAGYVRRSFADHYSQARQFFRSQQPVEQSHIVDAFVFELSKVQDPAIRERMVGNLRNVDEQLASSTAEGLGLAKLPAASPPAAAPVDSLPPSDKLSILANPPTSFAGRKVGVLVSDGASAKALKALLAALDRERTNIEVIAPTIAGVRLDDRSRLVAQQKLGGGPSVLYDAVAIVVSEQGAQAMATQPATKDFVNDAHAHGKFVGYVPAAEAIFAAAGLGAPLDDGYIDLTGRNATRDFITACRTLRFWERLAKQPVL